MSEFFRFPHTAHLAWLGEGSPRDDKVLSPIEVQKALQHELIVEEKMDGANLGICLDGEGRIQVQNRGSYLKEPFRGQFSRLSSWLGQNSNALQTVLTDDVILFGEWCAATHSIPYRTLPDFFLLFDVYSRKANAFWSTSRRNKLANFAQLSRVPTIGSGRFDLTDLRAILDSKITRYGSGPMEGVIVRADDGDLCSFKAKLVRADFIQGIDEHWSKSGIQWNRLAANGDL